MTTQKAFLGPYPLPFSLRVFIQGLQCPQCMEALLQYWGWKRRRNYEKRSYLCAGCGRYTVNPVGVEERS